MFEINFLSSLEEGYGQYLEVGSRSNKKIIPIHKCIAEHINPLLDIRSLGIGDSKEYCFQGSFMKKNMDVSVLKNDIFDTGISFKFVTGNYAQNSNNYFENMIGECVNVKRCNVKFGHIMVVMNKTPYRNKDNEITKIEYIKEHQLNKYRRLMNSTNSFDIPDALAIVIIDISDDFHVSYTDINSLPFSNGMKESLTNELSLRNFKEVFMDLI